jgi:UPF0755 protein
MRSGGPTPSQRIKSAIAVLVSLAVLGGMGLVVYRYGAAWYEDYQQRDDYTGEGEADIEITIPAEAGWQRVGDILERNDVIRDAETFMELYEEREEANGEDEDLIVQMGRYQMKTHWPAATALDYLLDPSHREVNTATIPEGQRWNDQIKPELAAASQLSEAAFDAAAANPAGIGVPEYANGQVEGYLFPDTYELPEDAAGILSRMTSQFKAVAAEIGLEEGAATLGLSAHDVVTVASIIEAEVNSDEYRPMVARAIYNRLARGIPVGVESAFRYGRLVTSGVPYDDPITSESQYDASLPYNYYQNPGLPGSAISNPGRAALNAAVHPAAGDYIYWVTVNLDTGETKFTAYEWEFNQYVAEFQSWCANNGYPAGCQ